MPQVDTNGIKIEYRFDGKEGAPYITFVTGIANDLTMWDAQVQALGKDYRTLRYDLRGHGDTLATEGDYSMELLVRDLAGLLNELNIQKTHLVGLGLGGAGGKEQESGQRCCRDGAQHTQTEAGSVHRQGSVKVASGSFGWHPVGCPGRA